jgi:ubiquinone/menaquinone biosynthesis C-methylase UbiE
MEDPQRKAQATYNAAADSYDDPANEYWDRYGRGTVEGLQLRPGVSVLDVACGTGASALPAAEAVGSTGRVVGVDLADQLLAIARAKAEKHGLRHVEFRNGDMTRLDIPDENFDAIVCVFAIFFVPDMEGLVEELWRMVRPGGKLAITTWGPRIFEPMYSAFDEALRSERPDLVSDFRPWDRITDVPAVEKLLIDGGATTIEVEAEDGQQPLAGPESWWSIVLGSGLRSVVEAMGLESAERVREHNQEFIREHGVGSITTNVIYGRATKAIS